MQSLRSSLHTRLHALAAMTGLLASLTLGSCGRTNDLTAPRSQTREESGAFAAGGVKGKPKAPAAPTLSAPVNGASNVATSPTLVWNVSAGASSYQVQVSTSASFATTLINSAGLTATSLAVSGLANSTTYFWRVNARSAGGTSAFSNAFSFTTAAAPVGNAPGVPVLSSPINGAIDAAIDLSLAWLPSAGATSYRLQLATDNTFAAPVSDLSGILATSQSFTGLLNSTTYFWRVSATNANGSSVFSAPFSFTTAAAAPPPPPPGGGPCSSLVGQGGLVANQTAEVVQFRPGNRLRIEIAGDVAAGIIDALGACSTTDPVSVIWPSGSASATFAGTSTSITGGSLTFGQLLFPGALLEPGVVVTNDAAGNVLEIIWPEIAGLGVGAPILRLQLAQWDPAVASGTALDVNMTFVARAADGSSAVFSVQGRNLIVP